MLFHGRFWVELIFLNLKGQLYQHYYQAGLDTVESYTLNGEPKYITQQIRSAYKEEAGWAGSPNPEVGFDTTAWDALLEGDASDTLLVLNYWRQYTYDKAGNMTTIRLYDTNSQNSFTV